MAWVRLDGTRECLPKEDCLMRVFAADWKKGAHDPDALCSLASERGADPASGEVVGEFVAATAKFSVFTTVEGFSGLETKWACVSLLTGRGAYEVVSPAPSRAELFGEV
jgi:hypothetical protein